MTLHKMQVKLTGLFRDVNETRDSKKILDLENYISRPLRIPRI